MIIGISGQAGSGKDTTADFLVKNNGFVKVSFADPLKRICKDVYDFSDEQLWGASEKRNEPDKRYPREIDDPSWDAGDYFEANRYGIECPKVIEHLTTRFALQILGTEWARNCYENTWVDYALRVAKKLSVEGGYNYDARLGLTHPWKPGDDVWKYHVVIPDVRFKNEITGIKNAGGKVVRIVRSGAGLKGAASAHQSEAEMREISDDEFDCIIENDGSLQQLKNNVEVMLHTFR